MAKFQGMTVNGKFCATAREAADRAGVTPDAIYNRVKKGWQDGDPISNAPPTRYRNITFRGKVYDDVPAAVKAEGVSKQAVYQHLHRTGQTGA